MSTLSSAGLLLNTAIGRPRKLRERLGHSGVGPRSIELSLPIMCKKNPERLVALFLTRVRPENARD